MPTPTQKISLQNVFDERFVPRLLWPPRSPNLYPCDNHLSTTLTDATYVNFSQTFHGKSSSACPETFSASARPSYKLEVSTLRDNPVQYGKLNREGCDLELRSVRLSCTHAFADVATGDRICSQCGKWQAHSIIWLYSVRLSQWFQHFAPRGALRLEETTKFMIRLCLVSLCGSLFVGVPVTTAWRVLRLRMEERPPIWRVAANKLNKQ